MSEGERVFRICNACRYCEGFCAVFPAMERSRRFDTAELDYLANLCHNCAECLDACPYAPPHEFHVDLPRLLADIRTETYRRYSGPAFDAGGRATWAILAVFLIAAVILAPGRTQGADFYSVLPHGFLVSLFGAIALGALGVMAIGLWRFSRDIGVSNSPAAFARAAKDAATLRYGPAPARSRLHHLVFYGFTLCFASTTVAALYHYALNLRAPYGYLSLPVVLGAIGGLAMVAGTAGMLLLRRPDTAFIALLLLTALTGLLLLAFRETPLMGELLAIHLATVAALFVTMPFGKFVHGLYRLLALMKTP